MTTTQASSVLEVAIPGVVVRDGWRKANTVEIDVRGADHNEVVSITNLIFDAIAASGTCLPESRSYPSEHEDNGVGTVIAGPAAAVRALLDDDLAFDIEIARALCARSAELTAIDDAEAAARRKAQVEADCVTIGLQNEAKRKARADAALAKSKLVRAAKLAAAEAAQDLGEQR